MNDEKGFTLIRTRLCRNLVIIQQGFTLIELLITIAILSILFALGFASYRTFSRSQQLQGIARQLRGDLSQAQQNALSGIKPSSSFANYTNCVSPNTLNGYGFTRTSTTTYNIYAICSAGNVNYPTKTLPPGFVIVIAPAGDIQFKTLGQGTTIPAGSQKAITIGDSVTGATQIIIVSDTGGIK